MIFGAATSVGRSTGTVSASRRSWMSEVCSSIKDAVVVKKGYLMLDRAVRAAEVGVVKGE